MRGPSREAGRLFHRARLTHGAGVGQIETTGRRVQPDAAPDWPGEVVCWPSTSVSSATESGRQAAPKRSCFGKAHIERRVPARIGKTRRSTRPHDPWRCDEGRSCHIYRSARETETAARLTLRRSEVRSCGISTDEDPKHREQNPWLRGVSNDGTARRGTGDKSHHTPRRRLPPTQRILEPLARRKHPGGGACETCRIGTERNACGSCR